MFRQGSRSVALAWAAVAAGCAGAPSPPAALVAPPLAIVVSSYRGSLVGGPMPESANGSSDRAVEVVAASDRPSARDDESRSLELDLFAIDRIPEATLDPASDTSELYTTSIGDSVLKPAAVLTRGARVGAIGGSAQLLRTLAGEGARVTAVGNARAALTRGRTTTVWIGEPDLAGGGSVQLLPRAEIQAFLAEPSGSAGDGSVTLQLGLAAWGMGGAKILEREGVILEPRVLPVAGSAGRSGSEPALPSRSEPESPAAAGESGGDGSADGEVAGAADGEVAGAADGEVAGAADGATARGGEDAQADAEPPAAEESTLAVIVPVTFSTGDVRGLAAVISIGEPVEISAELATTQNDEPPLAEGAEPIDVARASLARTAVQLGADGAPPSGASAERTTGAGSTWPGVVDVLSRLEVRPGNRSSCLFLAAVSGAALSEDLVLAAEDDVIARWSALVGESRRAAAPANEKDLAWLLESATVRLLADSTGDAERLPPAIDGLLCRHAGELGMRPAQLKEIASQAKGIDEFRDRILRENLILLEDSSPAARSRAWEWLRSQGRAPPGYDPLAPARERRQALIRLMESSRPTESSGVQEAGK